MELTLIKTFLFQSTLPEKGATTNKSFGRYAYFNFNPRSLRRERQVPTTITFIAMSFQSTLPEKGATLLLIITTAGKDLFQSTLPEKGATLSAQRTTERK